MGIYDREYYRSESPGFFGSFSGRGSACKWLIAVNVAAFVIQLSTRTSPGDTMDGWFTNLFVLDADRVLHGEIWRLLSYSFLHSFAWSHIVFNMLFLWMFGSELEEMYGSKEFLGFYLLAALSGGFAYFAWSVITGPILIPIQTFDSDGALIESVRRLFPPAYGASGAVTAVMVLFAFHFPTRTILLFFIIPVPIYLLVVFNVVQDTIGLFGGSKAKIAFAVHLGGAAFGFAYYKLKWQINSWLPSVSVWRNRRFRPKLRVFRGDPEPRPLPVATRNSEGDEHIEAELDAVLAKVAKLGKSSLSEKEERILLRASEIYRRRRK